MKRLVFTKWVGAVLAVLTSATLIAGTASAGTLADLAAALIAGNAAAEEAAGEYLNEETADMEAVAATDIDAAADQAIADATTSVDGSIEEYHGSSETGRAEGPGYDTPEEAVAAYIEGLAANDYDAMLAAFAVETYVDHYDLEAAVDRISMYQAIGGQSNYVPTISDFSWRLNVELRKAGIMTIIHHHYLLLTQSPIILDESSAEIAYFVKNYDSAQDLVDTLFVKDDSAYLSDIRFDGVFHDPVELSDMYGGEVNQQFFERQLVVTGAEEIRSVVAEFYQGSQEYYLMVDAVKYDGKWYIGSAPGNIAVMVGLNQNCYGLTPVMG